jgi:hypothetical protein
MTEGIENISASFSQHGGFVYKSKFNAHPQRL